MSGPHDRLGSARHSFHAGSKGDRLERLQADKSGSRGGKNEHTHALHAPHALNVVSDPICLNLHLPQRVWEGTYLDVPAVIKQRFSKKYRHASLDTKITQLRLKQVLHLCLILQHPAWQNLTSAVDAQSCKCLAEEQMADYVQIRLIIHLLSF